MSSERDEPGVGFETLSAGVTTSPSPAATHMQVTAPSDATHNSATNTLEKVAAVEIIRETPDALTPERLLKRHARVPEAGWRRTAYKLTGGAWNPGESPEELERRRLEALTTARCTENTRFVAVLARKGGVGKTTTATVLGMTMARLRHDRIVALDANPDRGTLADRAPRQTTATVWDVVSSAASVGSFADMSRLVSRDVTRLDVIASETEPSRARAFGADDYKSVAELLRRYYSVVITDCGTDFTHDVIPAILDYADAVVVVAGASVDEARLASETLDMIAALGHPELAANAVVAVQSASQSPVNLAEVTKHFNSRARGVVRIPRDPHLAEGSIVELDRLSPSTRKAALELASLVVSGINDEQRLSRRSDR